jgi:hypothetical protein
MPCCLLNKAALTASGEPQAANNMNEMLTLPPSRTLLSSDNHSKSSYAFFIDGLLSDGAHHLLVLLRRNTLKSANPLRNIAKLYTTL